MVYKKLRMNYVTRKLRCGCLMPAFFLLLTYSACGQSSGGGDDYISSVRPTVSEDATIQKKGVLQIETGGDFDFHLPEFRNAQDDLTGIYFAPTKRLRLDFEFETVVSQKDLMRKRETGIGDVNLGFKAIVRDDPKKHLAAAFAYSIKLPTANADKNLGTGKVDHNLRLILDRAYGKNDFVVNASYLNVGREMSSKRASGAQIVFKYERELSEKISFINEVFGNSVDENQPRGLYYLGALTYKIGKRIQFDVGARPGFGSDAPRIGVFGGFVVGIGK